MVDGGSNVCITGDLQCLVNIVNIPPIPITVVLEGGPWMLDDYITKQGLLSLTLPDGTTYCQSCYYCANMVETIISLAAILASSDEVFYSTQVGCKDPTTSGHLQFTSCDGCLSIEFDLEYRKGLYYCKLDVYTNGQDPIHVQCTHIFAPANPDVWQTHAKCTPTTKMRQVESEVWTLWFGSPGKHQFDFLPQNVISTSPVFEYHPFCYIDFKDQAYIQKQAAQQMGECIPTCSAEFYMDFGFMRSFSEIIKDPIRLQTVLSHHMMDTPHILSLMMVPLAGFGCSLPKWKNLLLTFSGPLCQNSAWLKVLSDLIRAVRSHKVVHSEIWCLTNSNTSWNLQALIVFSKMEAWRYTVTHRRSMYRHCFMAPGYL